MPWNQGRLNFDNLSLAGSSLAPETYGNEYMTSSFITDNSRATEEPKGGDSSTSSKQVFKVSGLDSFRAKLSAEGISTRAHD